jgi:hypothetical protein
VFYGLRKASVRLDANLFAAGRILSGANQQEHQRDHRMPPGKRSPERIIDPARRKSVHSGPEEVVRQNVIAFLTDRAGIPLGLIAVEKSIGGPNVRFRPDIVVHTRDGNPWMIVECKAPDVALTQRVFDQIGVYNRLIRARFLLVTNGQQHYCSEWKSESESWASLAEFPAYPET